MIPLHVIDAIGDSTLRDIDVWSPDTDVLILLMDLVAHGRLGAFTKLNFLTGKGDKYRSQRRVESHRTYPCPLMTTSSLPSNSLATGCSQASMWWTVSCPKKCSPSRSLFDQYTAPGGGGGNNHTSIALGTVQVQESGGREASSDQSNTDTPNLTSPCYVICDRTAEYDTMTM